MPSKILDLAFPFAGVNRSLAFQKQGPYTCYDALNVRPRESFQTRTRGGSRPGLMKFAPTTDSLPVRLLDTVRVKTNDKFDVWRDSFRTPSMSHYSTLTGFTSTVPTISRGFAQAPTTARSFVVPTPSSFNSSAKYRLGIEIVPYLGLHGGTYELVLGNASTPDYEACSLLRFTVTSAGAITAKLVTRAGVQGGQVYFDVDTGGAGSGGYDVVGPVATGNVIHGEAEEGSHWAFAYGVSSSDVFYESTPGDNYRITFLANFPGGAPTIDNDTTDGTGIGVTGPTDVETTVDTDSSNDGSSLPGWLEIERNSNTIKGYWRGTEILSGTITGLSTGMAVTMTPTTGRPQIARVRLKYYRSANFDLLRPVMIYSEDGNIHHDRGMGDWVQSAASRTVAKDRTLSSAERGQKLYIADYSEVIASGTNGVIATNAFSAASVADWRTLFASATPARNHADYALHISSLEPGVSPGTVTPNILTFDSTTIPIQFDTVVGTNITVELTTAAGTLTLFQTTGLTFEFGSGTDDGSMRFYGTRANVNSALDGMTFTRRDEEVELFSIVVKLYDSAGELINESPFVFSLPFPVSTINGLGTYAISSVAELSLTIVGIKNLTNCTWEIRRCPKVYDPIADTLVEYRATTGRGTIPVDCTGIARYRDRIVMYGFAADPNEWIMSRQGDPDDWLLSDVDIGAAVKGSNSEAGRVGDAITAFVPYGDQYALFGCRSSVWRLNGDPMAGGTIDVVTYEYGILSATSWCHGEKSGEAFVLTRRGLKATNIECPTCELVDVSEGRLPDELLNIDPSLFEVSLGYEHAARGILICVTPKTSATMPSGVTHWFFDIETKGFFPQAFAAVADNPVRIMRYQGADADDDCLLMARHGGGLNRFSTHAETDNGTAISKYTVYGPFPLGRTSRDFGGVDVIEATLAADSGDVTYEIAVGSNAEEAVSASAAFSGGFSAGGLPTCDHPRVRGGAFTIKVIGGVRPLAIETLTVETSDLGPAR